MTAKFGRLNGVGTTATMMTTAVALSLVMTIVF